MFESLKNELVSMENWVEKYQPLRLQNQICESVCQVLHKKQRRKLKAISEGISSTLREEVFRDVGHPRLQEKCLQIITMMRLE